MNPAPSLRVDRVFFALADPIRRKILERLDGEALLVSELAARASRKSKEDKKWPIMKS